MRGEIIPIVVEPLNLALRGLLGAEEWTQTSEAGEREIEKEQKRERERERERKREKERERERT